MHIILAYISPFISKQNLLLCRMVLWVVHNMAKCSVMPMLLVNITIYSFVNFSLFPSFVQSHNLRQVFLLICYIVTLSNQVRDHISKWIIYIYCQNIIHHIYIYIFKKIYWLYIYNILLQFMTWSVPNQGLLITPRLTVSCRPPVSLKYLLLLYIICIDSV